jgi:hypothetical protein
LVLKNEFIFTGRLRVFQKQVGVLLGAHTKGRKRVRAGDPRRFPQSLRQQRRKPTGSTAFKIKMLLLLIEK